MVLYAMASSNAHKQPIVMFVIRYATQHSNSNSNSSIIIQHKQRQLIATTLQKHIYDDQQQFSSIQFASGVCPIWVNVPRRQACVV